ncbi:monocarboxylate transporter-like protein [Leptomonas pyrrhocoris]|uniref:Monocarboxylate transporter-like protein n=1 Tax=Leptomonas pyrrhocoris TaxID=157538 RepID=A0A0N0DVU1_LEPPY|nr:monocarboxylate transporter-like protein [Leptomonas pyrrhocoris]KPA80818.1 monocarboxylate transporter-like protein [Leptomonas pyrrhocoris]|eukprot:XP_015659257.1 monocarboxylate transporter-like protein [Leptomonas pyrrhocoris]
MQLVQFCKRIDRAVTHKPADHWIGYIVAISGALMQMMSYGIDNSFSIFSNSMQNDPTLGYPSATMVSFGNSVSLGLSPIFGVLAGFLVDRVPPRVMMFLSTVMLFAGLWLSSSFAKSSAQVTAAYSLLASISSAFMLSPGAAATSSWFRRRLGLGQGINFCGGGIGSAVVPAVLGSLVDVYGWRKTFRLMSAFCSIGLVGTFLSCRRHPIEDDVEVEPRDRRSSHSEADTAVSSSYDDQPDHAEHAVLNVDPNNQRETPELMLDEGVAAASDIPTKPKPSGNAAGTVMSPVSNAESNRTPRDTRNCTVDELIEDMHTRRLRWPEIFCVFFSVRFLSHFFMFAIYGWAFYGLIYVAVPYVSSMGAAGTVYADVTPISTSKASTVFTFWGSFQIIGSVLIGALASITTDAFAYTICASVGGVSTALLIFCRGYAAFAVCWSIVGFCTAGVFAMMPALIARDFHGPNLGFFMGCVFVAGCLGGFSAPPIQAQLQTRYHGNYSYGCVFISCCMTFPGVLCYLFLWPEKQSRVGRAFKRLVKQV